MDNNENDLNDEIYRSYPSMNAHATSKLDCKGCGAMAGEECKGANTRYQNCIDRIIDAINIFGVKMFNVGFFKYDDDIPTN